MGKIHETINDTMKEFLENSPVFFVATAPKSGHINVSPKGLDSFRVISPTQVAYLDFTGSGIETIAHLKENGRITFLFTAFSGNPNIIRLYGNARPVLSSDPEFSELAKHFAGNIAGARSIIVADLTRISDSCGFGVPLMDFVGQRSEMPDWLAKKGEEGLAKYRAEKNVESIDGLAGI